MIRTIFIALFMTFAISSAADAGSGRTDAYGCHYHKGVYVCH